MQRTIARAAKLTGIGVHRGEPATARILPAPCDYGIRFIRTDVIGLDKMVEARFDAVTDTALCTTIANADRVSVATIEHLMAALAGCGIDNATVEIDGAEAPIMDGSAAPFVRAIRAAGVIEQAEPLRALRILKPVRVEHEGRVAALEPAETFEIDFRIEFDASAIGTQQRAEAMHGDAFLRHYADSRTFGRLEDVEKLRQLGFARGGSLENAVVVDGDRVLNPGGLRHRDEFVRHKMLDVVGDLALAGAPIIGRYRGLRAGHDMTNRLLHALFAERAAWRYEIVEGRGALVPDLASAPTPALAVACA